MVLKAVGDGGGSSHKFEMRGPLMVAGKYDPPTMKVDMHQKDINIINEFANRSNCPTPLLSAATQIYAAALAIGYAKHDTASVCAVLEEMAGIKRESSKS